MTAVRWLGGSVARNSAPFKPKLILFSKETACCILRLVGLGIKLRVSLN